MKRILILVCLLAVTVGAWAVTKWGAGGARFGPETLQSSACAVGNGTALQVNNTTKALAVYTTWGTGTTAGSVVVETSDDPTYTGTWATAATVNWAAESTKILTSIVSSCPYVRARIATRVAASAAKTITGITKASPPVVTSTSHGFANGDKVYITGVVGMTEVNGISFTVANKADNTFELSGIVGAGYTTYTSDGTATKDGAVTVTASGTN